MCSRSLMKVQHAPSPVQAALLVPEIVASPIIQSKNGGITSQRKTSTITVSRVFESELKRLRRSQSTARPPPPPPSRRSRPPPGAVSDGASAVIVSPLHQGDV